MSSELLATARAIVQRARRQGARGVRALVYRSRESILEWRDGKLDRVRESTQLGLSAALYVDGRYSAHTTSDLRPEALDRFLGEAVALTRVLQPDPHRRLADPQRYAGRHAGELETYDAAGAAAMTPAERRRVVTALEAGARAEQSHGEVLLNPRQAADRLVVTATSTDTVADSALCTSNGMEGTRRGTNFSVFAVTIIKGLGARKPTGTWYASARRRADLPSPESVGREATRRALFCVGEKPRPSGLYACVVENAVAERLLQGLLEPLQGSALQQRRSFLAGKVGAAVASPALSITDDPLYPRGLSSRAYDGEGMSTVARPIIERGVLRSTFLDTYYASKLRLEPTIAEPTNLRFAAGKRDLPALLRALGTGILITGFSGGNSNPATGDFSIGVRGQWIEDGVMKQLPVAEMNLAGNHLELWRKLRETGSDPYAYSSAMCPSLRFGAVQFSGT